MYLPTLCTPLLNLIIAEASYLLKKEYLNIKTFKENIQFQNYMFKAVISTEENPREKQTRFLK